jgi:hypothetical protein
MLASAATEVNEPWVVSRLSARVRFQVSPRSQSDRARL